MDTYEPIAAIVDRMEGDALGTLATRAAVLARRVGRGQERSWRTLSASVTVLALIITSVGSGIVVAAVEGSIQVTDLISVGAALGTIVAAIAVAASAYRSRNESKEHLQTLKEYEAVMQKLHAAILVEVKDAADSEDSQTDKTPGSRIHVESDADLESLLHLIREVEMQRSDFDEKSGSSKQSPESIANEETAQ